MKVLSYRLLLRPEPEGGSTVIVPALPGCITFGRTIAEAKRMSADAIAAYVESLKDHGERVPDDTGVLEEMLTLAHA